VSVIEVSRRGEVSVVLLNRPDRLNAFDGDMTTALMAAISEADNDPETKAIVITGAGRAFSAGGDVRAFGTNVDTRVNRRGWHLASLMLRVEKPTVAMVNGAAVGLGLTVALLCDAVVAAEDAKLGDTHVDLGLVAGDGAVVTLPLLIGPQLTKELLLTGRLVTGREAAEMGMVWSAYPADELEAAAFDLAISLGAQPTYAVRATKSVINKYVRWMSDQLLDVALAYEEISKHKPEHHDAVARWREGRAR
jgi:enoyl-CoA hydratase